MNTVQDVILENIVPDGVLSDLKFRQSERYEIPCRLEKAA